MIKKGIKVIVLSGKDKKKEGEVIEIDRSNFRAKVKDINMVKKHIKTTKEKKGGIVSKENFLSFKSEKPEKFFKAFWPKEDINIRSDLIKSCKNA